MSNLIDWQKITLYLVIGILVVVAFFGIKGCINNKQKATITINTTNVDSLVQANTKYRDENGRLHAELAQVTLTSEQAQIYFKKELDSVARLLKIRDGDIIALVKIIDSSSGSGSGKIDTIIKTITRDSIVYKDTIFQVNFDDKYLHLQNTIDKGGYDLNYIYRDSLTLIQYYKTQGLKKIPYLDVFSSNPNADVKIKSYQIQDLYTERITVTAGMNFTYWNGWKVYPGINIGYRLFGIKFKKK